MIGIRPEHLEISAEGRFSLQAEFVEKLGSVQLVHGSFAGKDFILQCPATHPVAAGQQLRFDIPAASMHAFDPTTGARLLQPEAIERRKEPVAA
jgi:sn-glycerol 3-phosphate transport system ATP-binding protein